MSSQQDWYSRSIDSDLERRDVTSAFFSMSIGLRWYGGTVSPRATKFGMVTCGMFAGGQPHPIAIPQPPPMQRPHNFWTLYLRIRFDLE